MHGAASRSAGGVGGAATASSDVTTPAPRSSASAAASSSTRATSTSGASVASARCRARTIGSSSISAIRAWMRRRFGPEPAVEDGRQQGMREADERAVTFDDPRPDGGLERVRGGSCLLEQRLCCRADDGCDRKGLPRAGGQRLEPRPHELVERFGNRKRLQWFDGRGQSARDLEREERVPPGALVDAEQRLPRKRRSQAITQEPMKRARTQWSDGDALHAVDAEGMFELGLPRLVAQPLGEQDGHGVRVQPPQGERQRVRRRRVEPLDVVDRNERGPTLAQQLQRIANRHRDRAARDGVVHRLTSEQRDLERAPAWGGRSGSTSSTIGSRRSPRPAYVSPRSGSEGRDDSTCNPSARAYSTAASQSVDFPIPASPSRTSACAPPAASPSTKV